MFGSNQDTAVHSNSGLPGNILIPCRFVWPHGGRRVFLSGSFTGWSESILMSPMEGCPTAFQAICNLSPGYHQYKFNVDGEWRYDENQPFASGAYGVVNTMLLPRESDISPVMYSSDTPGRSNMEVDDNMFVRPATSPDGMLREQISEADVQVSRHRISLFLSQHTAYELLPESGKVVALDVTLPVKQAFHVLYEQGVPVAPLWDFSKGNFVGVLSAIDFILILRELGNHGSNLTEEELETHTILAWKDGKIRHNRQIEGSGRPYARKHLKTDYQEINMYTTRPLSHYRKSPEALSLPPEGPNSGYLVIQDEESTPTYFFGLFKDSSIKDLPFPQNKRLSIRHTTRSSNGPNGHNATRTTSDDVYLIPVINQPLSSNRYYAIQADGTRKGETYASSKDQDKVMFCFCIPCIQDVKPRPPFDPEDNYQQFEFSVTQSWLGEEISAKSVAADGHPPEFLRKHGWHIDSKSMKNFTMGEARGVDSSLRGRFPDLSFPSSQEYSEPVVVGKWYCPFMFIKDGREKDQIKKSVYYEMTLEQRWERIFAADRTYSQGKTVTVDVVVPTETVRIAGQEATQGVRSDDRRFVWFKTIDGSATEEQVGLSSLIVERMMWEEARVGWANEKEKCARVVRDEEYGGVGDWTSFGCYVLVEGFVLKRIDGSIALRYDFRHTHQIRSKWE